MNPEHLKTLFQSQPHSKSGVPRVPRVPTAENPATAGVGDAVGLGHRPEFEVSRGVPDKQTRKSGTPGTPDKISGVPANEGQEASNGGTSSEAGHLGHLGHRKKDNPEKYAPASVAVDQRGLPAAPCAVCHERHFWRDVDGWRCSDCAPMPAGFLGETVSLPGGKPAASTTTRADLEAIHPANVAGVPLAVILDQADPADFDALRDRATLKAFTRSLLAHGEIQAKEGRP